MEFNGEKRGAEELTVGQEAQKTNVSGKQT